MNIDWSRFKQLIDGHQQFLLTSHMRPDCDALGSELAMADVLAALGKQVAIVNGDAVPANAAFIDPERRVRQLGVDVAADALPQHDLVMVLDTSSWGQLGPMADCIRATSATVVVLDHHASDNELPGEEFKDPTVEATGRLVFEAAGVLGVKLSSQTAFSLLAAITTDTGWFRFSNTSGETLRAAAALLDAGAEPPRLYSALYEQKSLPRIKLAGTILARAETFADGAAIHSAVFEQDFAGCGADRGDTEGVINEMMAVAGIEAATLLTAVGEDTFKVSLRSRQRLDCRRLAEEFGGGGHTRAAGLTYSGSYQEARARILAEIEKRLE